MKPTLRRALRLSSPSTIAIVGAGGKTSALYQLGREYFQEHALVLLTTSTHLGYDQVFAADHHILYRGGVGELLEKIRSSKGIVCLTAEWTDHTKRWKGLDQDILQHLAQYTLENDIPLLIEADGARGRSLKAPADHEPVIPPFCDAVILVAGLAAVGKPLSQEWVHRPEQFAELSGISLGEAISTDAVRRVLNHPLGGRKGIPAAAKSHVLLTQAETHEAQAVAKKLSFSLLDRFDSIVVAAKGIPLPSPANKAGETPCAGIDFRHPYHILATHEPIAGVVLAAGASSRFGQPKPLLLWRGETLVHRAARLALETGLQPVIVVCGAEGDRVAAAVADLPVRVIRNPNWQNGQSASIRAALLALGDVCGGAIFILVDQPFISISLLQTLVENHAQSLAPVIAPLVGDQRANPVLFDQQTFNDLLNLEGDVGGRAIFHRYPPQWLVWHDTKLLLDLDTPEDFHKLLKIDEHDE